MKKDIFNGKIQDIKQAYIALTMETIVFILCATVMICAGVFYDNFGIGARELTFAMGVVSFICSIALPVTTICFVRKYPKHKKLCHMLLKSYLFTDEG